MAVDTGFPMIKGLSLGKTVIARRSELVCELADLYRGPGTLVDFETTEELVEAVGRLLHELPLPALPLGAALSDQETAFLFHDFQGTG